MKASTNPIDLSYLHMVTGGDKDFEKKILSTAVTDIQTKVDNLQRAFQKEDVTNIRTNAHSLKSLSAIVGITSIEKLSRTIDNLFSGGYFFETSTEPMENILTEWYFAKHQLLQMLEAYQ